MDRFERTSKIDGYSFLKGVGLSAALIAICCSLTACPALNGSGDDGPGIDPTVAPSYLSYPKIIGSYIVGTAIMNNIPTVTGSVTGYTISPDLPVGLILNPTTGVISGTPTTVSPITPYTVTATNAYGTTTAQIGMVVYATAGATVTGTVMLPASVTNKLYTVTFDTDHDGGNGGQVALAVGYVTGDFFTYLVENVPAGAYNIYAVVYSATTGTPGAPIDGDFNSGDATLVTISGTGNYTVNRVCSMRGTTPLPTDPRYYWYPAYYKSYLVGTMITDHSPTWPYPWSVISYSIDPSLTTGLSFNAATGTISGTPEEALASPTGYTVTANYLNGSVSTKIGMAVYATAGATISGTVTLPAAVTDKVYLVQVDTDHDGGNGGQVAYAIGTVTGSSFNYTIENVPAGDFMVYATVGVVNDWDDQPQSGDYGSSDLTILSISGTSAYAADRTLLVIP